MNSGDEGERITIGRWQVRPSELRVTDGVVENVVEAKVMDVLLVLVERRGQVVLREDLIDAVWGTEAGGDERLTRAISLLRKALGDTRGSHEYIRTVPRKGYQLIAETMSEAASETTETPETAAPAPRPARPGRRATDVETSKPRRSTLVWALAAVVGLVGLLAFGRNLTPPSAPVPPLVMIMDSAHPARVYDDAVRDSGGTNADILSDILADLPVRTQKELISPSWHRYEAIMRFEPDLIVIHYSGFKQEDASGPRPQLKLLIEYFLKTKTKFLVYSRASEGWLDNKMNIVLEDLRPDHPDLDERIQIYPLVEYGEPNWMAPSNAQGIKLKIKEILELE